MNKIAMHLTVDELKSRMSDSDSLEQFRRYQVIFLRLSQPNLSVGQISDICNVAYRTVTQWTWLYNTGGPDKLVLSGRGGRRNAHLSEEAEKDLLVGLQEKAGKGQLITALKVKKAAEKVLGKPLPKDYAYDLLHRHGWRKIMPHTHHPKKSLKAQEAFKKTLRPFWLPPEKS